MEYYKQKNIDDWDKRAQDDGLHAVFTHRWTDDECNSVHEVQESMLLGMLPSLAEKNVLDLGCGIGRLTRPLRDRARSVIGLDISSAMLQRARSSSPNVPFVQASAGYLCFRSGAFDAVFASFIFQHILDNALFQCALRECVRVLRPGGHLICMDGLADVAFRPDNSKVTQIRTFDQYWSVIKPFMSIRKQTLLECVEDQYTLMLWQKETPTMEG